LSQHYGIPQISTGELLRQAVQNRLPLGLEAQAAMDQGLLVSDTIVMGIIRDRLAQPDTRSGFLLDGFPRNLEQAQALAKLLETLDRPLTVTILFRVDSEYLIQRLSGRLTCPQCGAVYNRYTSPPRFDDQCDNCGTLLRHRSDDNEETIINRLRVYEAQTEPLISFYQSLGLLAEINADGAIPAIFRQIRRAINEHRHRTARPQKGGAPGRRAKAPPVARSGRRTPTAGKSSPRNSPASKKTSRKSKKTRPR
jgi:adenylate kinase